MGKAWSGVALGLLLAAPSFAQALLGVSASGEQVAQGPGRAALAAQFAGADPSDAYPARLAAVRELAARFPGRIAPVGFAYREMGLFAGIYLQTSWQHESGRDELPIWYVVNRNLTLAPRAYMAEYEANPDLPFEQSPYVLAHPTRGGPGAPITVVDACRAWKTYFQLADQAQRDAASPSFFARLRGDLAARTTVTKALWHAHTTGIRFALWQHADELTRLAIPDPELAFWRGWIRVVYFSENLAPSTTDLILKPFLSLLMPPCSPLGREGCGVGDQPEARETFIRWMSYGQIDQAHFLARFGGQEQSAPLTMATSAAAVPQADDIVLDAIVAKISAKR